MWRSSKNLTSAASEIRDGHRPKPEPKFGLDFGSFSLVSLSLKILLFPPKTGKHIVQAMFRAHVTLTHLYYLEVVQVHP